MASTGGMDWLKALVAVLVSTGTVVAILGFLGRKMFSHLLDQRLTAFTHHLNERLETLKHELGLEAQAQELARKSQIEFKERQLSEFYGPIYALLKRIRPIDDLRMTGKLDEVEEDVLNAIIDSNNRIVEIILTKSHLIDGDTIPESFTSFLTHVPIWHAFLKTCHRGFPKSLDLSEAHYQREFETQVFKTTERLKRDLDALYRRYGLIDVPEAK